MTRRSWQQVMMRTSRKDADATASSGGAKNTINANRPYFRCSEIIQSDEIAKWEREPFQKDAPPRPDGEKVPAKK